VTYYIEFGSVGGGWMVMAETEGEAIEKAKAMVIETVEEDIQQKNYECEPQ
jgi:hypothetical protein